MKIFRGYIPIRSEGEKAKTPIYYTNPRTGHYIKERKGQPDEEWLTLEEANTCKGYAGLLTGEAVVVDVDNEKESNLLLNLVKDLNIQCKAIKTTRGIHFYFKKPSNLPLDVKGSKMHALVRIGIEVDFLFAVDDPETGENIKEKYVVVKLKDKIRETIYNTDEIGEVPYWLFPMPKKEGIKFSDIHQGNRNNTLLTYQINLANQGLNETEIRETIKLINKYIMPEPLKDEDMEKITRPEAVQGAKEIVQESKGIKNKVLSSFLNGKTIKYDEYAQHLIDTLHIIKLNGFLHVYHKGIYKPNYKEKNIISFYIATHDFKNLTNTKHNEIMAAINRLIMEDSEPASIRLIPFKNGFINLDEYDPITMGFPLHPHNAENVFTQIIPWDYDPTVPYDAWERLFMEWANNRSDVAQVMFEAVGISLYRSTKGFDPKFFILTGGKNNGKTTFLKILTALLGSENVGSVPPQSFNERFSLAYLENKLANIVNDLDEDAVEKSGKLKELVDGTPLTVERKGEHPFTLEAYCTNIFACNNIPRIKDDSLATRKRLAIIPFDVEFNRNKANRLLVATMTTPIMMTALINIALIALVGVLDRKSITLSPTIEELTNRFASGSSSIIGFNDECQEMGYDFEGENTHDVYNKYKDFCIENGFTAFSLINFSRKLCKIANLETIRKRDGFDLVKIFVKKSVPDVPDVPD